MNFEEIKKDVENKLSEKRFEHTCGVIKVAEELASLYGVDVQEAKIAAALHDVAKEMTDEEVGKYLTNNKIELGEVINYPKVIHSHIGASVAKLEYGIENEDILNAIKYHTTGRPDMSMLEKIIYLADFIDDTRDASNYQETYDTAKALIYDKKIDEAMKVVLERTIMHLKGNIYIDTVNAFSFYNK